MHFIKKKNYDAYIGRECSENIAHLSPKVQANIIIREQQLDYSVRVEVYTRTISSKDSLIFIGNYGKRKL